MSAVPDLNSLRWQSRVVIIFATAQDDLKPLQQDALFAAYSQGFQDRDVKVFRVIGNTSEARELRRRLRIADHPFAVVLIGKDGSLKLRHYDPLSAEELFRAIDAMPMRRDEMKQR